MNLGIYRAGLRSRKCIDRRRATRTMLACKDILTLMLAWLVTATQCQSLPTRDEELFIHQMRNPETFHDSGLIPDGAEVNAYAVTETITRYFFLVEEDGPPLEVTITPCASTLEWNISIPEVPEEGSASGINDQLEHQRSHSSKVGSILKTYKGFNVSTYSSTNSPAGIYMLKVRAVDRDSSFKIYATTTPNSDRIYPVLPSDSRVDVTAVRKDRVSLAWKSSLSETVYLQPIKYCVAMNTERNYPTLCGIESRLYGDRRPIVPNVGFGFSNEKGKRNSKRLRKRKNKLELLTKTQIKTNSSFTLECIGTKKMHTFINLIANHTYFFDVFAVDTKTNRSAVYQHIQVTTPAGEEVQKVVMLKDGKMLDSSVQQSKPKKTFQIDVGNKDKELLVTVQSCTHPVIVEILQDTSVVKSGVVEDLQSFTINNAKGTYYIRVVGSLKEAIHFKIFTTTKPRKYPYPRMPDDNRINPYRNLRKCNSVTLGWLTSSETAQYCLYRREDTSTDSGGRKNLRLMNSCHGPGMRKRSEKVFCTKVNDPSEQDTVMIKKVENLKTGTNYIFDVYVSRDGKQSLAYRSVKVKTKKYC
ncbi:protein NDNF-like [Antedon mediterranea]|uniref:protein NDNF-like n=1 Tax=Antedon mediterranea TaxID=105859 RepID=UPI003AF58E69